MPFPFKSKGDKSMDEAEEPGKKSVFPPKGKKFEKKKGKKKLPPFFKKGSAKSQADALEA